MCKILNLPRSVYYYEATLKEEGKTIDSDVVKIFNENRKVYGTRKIKKVL